MKKQIVKLISVILIAAVLLTGCSGYRDGLYRIFAMLGVGGVVSSEKMVYTRPDLSAFAESVDRCCAMAAEGEDVGKLMEEVWICFGLYHDFYTNYYLADIRYCRNITDIYWDEEFSDDMDIYWDEDFDIDMDDVEIPEFDTSGIVTFSDVDLS